MPPPTQSDALFSNFTPRVHRISADNESADTFSFALVLICLVVGDIGYVRKGATVTSSSYALGMRPTIPAEVHERCAGLASLITEMWAGEFRERPSMEDVVTRLEGFASASLDGMQILADDRSVGDGEAAQTSTTLTVQQGVDEDAAITIARLRAQNEQQRIQIEALLKSS